MKKISIYLILIGLVSCNQAGKQEVTLTSEAGRALRQGCNYSGTLEDSDELCNFYRGNNFATYENAELALEKILAVTGMSKRFVLQECGDISNCVATSYKGVRYILYDREFMDAIASNTTSWSNLAILAHEIGHHVNGHSLDLVVYATEAAEPPTLSESRQMEIEADEYSGFIMKQLGASLSEAQEAITLLADDDNDSYSTHPSLSKRLKAIEKGYNRASGFSGNMTQGSSTTGATMTADDYFYLALNNEDDYEFQIRNYTLAIGLEPDFPNAYYNRGLAYYESEENQQALNDFSRYLDYYSDDIDALNMHGECHRRLENYPKSIADHTKAIRLNPDIADSYYQRGLAHYYSDNEKDAINDFDRCLRLDDDFALALFYRAESWRYLEKYEDAIADYTRYLRLVPDEVAAFYGKGFAHWNLEENEDAIKCFTRCIRLDPDYGPAYSARGWVRDDGYCNDFRKGCDLGDESGCDGLKEYCN